MRWSAALILAACGGEVPPDALGCMEDGVGTWALDGRDSDGDGHGETVILSRVLQVVLRADDANRTVPGLAVDDFDSDGHPDVVTSAPGRGHVRLYRGPFDPAQCDPSPDDALALNVFGERVREIVAPGDVDGDGHADLVVASGSTAFLLRGPIAGDVLDPWAAGLVAWHAPDATTHAVAAGDLDGDGLADLAIATTAYDQSAVTLLHGPADVALSTVTPTWVYPGIAFTTVTSPGDVTGDGWPDLAASDPAPLDHGDLFVFPSASPGPVPPEDDGIRVAASMTYEWLLAALPVDDLNGDGHVDLAILASRTPVVRVVFGPVPDDGSIVDSGAADATIASAEWVEDRGDVDGDGFRDLLVPMPDSRSTIYTCLESDRSALPAICQPGAVGFVAGPVEGAVSVVDILEGRGYHGHFGATTHAGADLDGDGIRDLAVAGNDAVYLLFGI